MIRIEELVAFLEYLEKKTMIGVPRTNADGSGCYSPASEAEKKQFAKEFLKSGLLPPKLPSKKKPARVRVTARRGWAMPEEVEVDETFTFTRLAQAKAFVRGAKWAGEAHQGFIGWENLSRNAHPNWTSD